MSMRGVFSRPRKMMHFAQKEELIFFAGSLEDAPGSSTQLVDLSLSLSDVDNTKLSRPYTVLQHKLNKYMNK